MPDGNGPAKAPQQEAGREGIIVRASAKLEEFRKAIRELFGLKEGDKKVKGSEKSNLDKILAIAEGDVARVKKEGAPLEKILEEAKAGLAGVTLKEDLSDAVEGLRRKQREEVEKALKDYREALVEVLKEGENPTVKKEEVVVVPELAEAASEQGLTEQNAVAATAISPEISVDTVPGARDPEEERLVDLVGELTIGGNDPKQAALLNAAQNADAAWTGFEKASGDEKEKAREAYEKAVLRLKNAYAEFQKPKSKRAPRAPKLEGGPREAWMDQVDEYLAGDLKDDKVLLAMLLEYEKPSEHVEEYEDLVSLASDAHEKLKRLKLEAGRIVADENGKNFDAYKEAINKVKVAAAAYVALGESPTVEKTAAPGGDVGKDFVARAQAEIAARREKNATAEQAEDERMQELRAKQTGSKEKERGEEVGRIISAIDDIRRLATHHAEQMIKSGEGSKIATDRPMVSLWEEMREVGVKIQTARALRGFLEGQVDEVVIEDENVPVDKQERKSVQASVSIFSREAVLEAARTYGFENEEALLAAAALPLPTEKKTSKGFASEAAEAARNKSKTIRLDKIAIRRGQIDTMLAGYKDMGTEPPGWVRALITEKTELEREKAGLEAELSAAALRVEREMPNADEEVVDVRNNELEAVSSVEEADDGVYAEGRVEGRPRKREKNADGSQAKPGTGNAPDIFDATDFSVEETKSAYEDTGSSAAPINPDATPPVPPVETSRIGIDTAELKTRTEAARAMIDSVNTGIAAWGKDRRDGVGQEYYIKDAVAYLERIIKRDEVFLALATPTEDDERAYSEERKAMLEGDLKRQYDRLFVLALKGSKKPYAEEFPAWITNAKKRAEVAGAKGDQDGRKREEVYAKEIEKRKEVIDAIRPFFEVWLKMETKEATVPVPDATAAPTPTPDASATPKPPEATPAPADASSPVPPEAAPATPPAVPKTPDASAAPVPPSAPPAAPPTPDKKAKAPVRPEPKFANAALFEGEDGKELLAWLKTHGPLVDDAKKVLDDEEQEKVLAQYAPFAEHATLLDNIVEVTTQLTQAKTPAERVISEARLVGLRQKAPGSIRAQATLDDLQAEKRAIKAEMEDDEDEPRAGVGREKREKNKARLAEIKALMSLVDKDVELERALMEVATMEGERDINKIKNTLDETEDREADAGKAWKDVMDEAKEAHDTLSENMQARSKPPGSEKYFGSLFEAFAKDQERAIEFNKVLRTFNVLDSAEVHITQTLRVLDREGSGPLAPGVWDEMPISVQEYLDKAGESDKSTIEGIKAKLYERLRAITRAKVEADRELQAHMQEIDTLEEKSSYALAQEVHAKLQEEDRQLLRQLSGLRAEIEMYNPAKAGKPQDKTFYTAKVEELTARLELTRNEQWHTNMLLKDSAALLEVAGRAPLRKSGSIGEVEASAIDALKSQKDITAALVKVMNGQEALAERKQELAARETELRASLPSAPSAQGGGASFGKGTPAPENRTSGGGGEKEKSMWESFMETGLGKSGKEFVEAFKFWQ